MQKLRRSALVVLAVTLGLALLPQTAEAGFIGVKSIKVTSALSGPEWFHVSEVVATQTGTGIDVALSANGALASSYSNYPGTSPFYAIDGIFPASHPNHYHSGSTNTSVEFLKINFFAAYELDSIALYGRTDCCSYKDIYNVTLLDVNDNVLYSATGLNANNVNHMAFLQLPDNSTQVPEPASISLVACGLAALTMLRGKTKS
jgi:hypothetical protein